MTVIMGNADALYRYGDALAFEAELASLGGLGQGQSGSCS